MSYDILEDAWTQTDTPKPSEGGSVVPDGAYTGLINRAAFGTTKTGSPMFSLEFIILEGEYARRKLFKTSFLEGRDPEGTSKAIQRFKQDVVNAGGSIPSKLDAEGRAILSNTLVDNTVKLWKQTKGKYTNIYINGCIEEGVDKPSSQGPVGLDDIPF